GGGGGGSSQWSDVAGGILYGGGDVGFGVLAPQASFYDEVEDSILAMSNDGNSTPLADFGAGTRLSWDPVTGAFRAGIANDTEWDSENIGTHSVAFSVGQ